MKLIGIAARCIFFALAIPLDDPITKYSMSVAFFFEANYKLPTKDDIGLEIQILLTMYSKFDHCLPVKFLIVD
ncbi:hypothetical protein V1477_005925 [Vespula maculifrons]|uniref:Secreted protein n=1 Tax=Vespula maculifrons TaxID=7453 RepID=A0ABD2CL91_VESMC